MRRVLYLAFLVALTLPAYAGNKCHGAKPCKCSDCTKCKHCSRGGLCGNCLVDKPIPHPDSKEALEQREKENKDAEAGNGHTADK